MTAEYWPWWVGGPLLALVAIAFPFLVHVPLGVSGALARLLRWRTEADGTASAPGTGQARNVASDGCSAVPAGSGCGDLAVSPVAGRVSGPDRWANVVFLAAIAAGGALAGWFSGRPWGSLVYSAEFQRLLTSGVPGLLVLFAGGVLVGFGTRLSGGCTSGHGLSGCGRLQPASLVATAVFFGVAIGVSFLLEAVRA